MYADDEVIDLVDSVDPNNGDVKFKRPGEGKV